MCLALFWMTINMPFVQRAQEVKIQNEKAKPVSQQEEEGADPINPPTEEKAGNSVSFSEEYIHHSDGTSPFSAKEIKHSFPVNTPLYIAFYGELISPPPDLA